MDPNEKESKESQSKARELLREWGFDPAIFEERAKKSMADTRGDLGEVTGALRNALRETKQTLLDLHKARQPVATELKNGFERAWEEIETAFAGARRKMRESREEAKEPETTVPPDE